MKPLRARHRGLGLRVAALAAAVTVALATLPGCTRDCEDSCDDAYRDCIDRAPPGAARSDCAQQHTECLQRCGTPA